MSKTPQAQKPAPLDKKEVRVALAKRGWTQAELANHIGVSLPSVSLTINHNTFPKVARKIRVALGMQ